MQTVYPIELHFPFSSDLAEVCGDEDTVLHCPEHGVITVKFPAGCSENVVLDAELIPSRAIQLRHRVDQTDGQWCSHPGIRFLNPIEHFFLEHAGSIE